MNLKPPMILLCAGILSASLFAGVADFLHFQVPLPEGCELVDVSPPMMDFCVFQIKSKAGKPLASIYAGNHPQFHFNPKEHTRTQIKSGIFLSKPKGNALPAEVLLEFDGLNYKGEAGSPWTCVHVFEITDSPGQRTAILASAQAISVSRPCLD